MKNIKVMIVAIFIIIISPIQSALAQTNSYKKCAILLHGLARSSYSMRPIKKMLEKNGFIVWNESYKSTKKTIQQLSPIISEALNYCENQRANELYFVSHSMGGILIRHYFQGKRNNKVKAIVMIAPPNQGSEIVDHFKNENWFIWYNGPAGIQLTSNIDGLPRSLRPIPFPIGIIAGNVSSDPWFSYLFKGPNDGKVSVQSAKLDNMKDFLVVPKGHTFIMNSPEVHKNILHFFEHHKFTESSMFY